MADFATKVVRTITRWKKTSGVTLLACLTTICTFVWKQWTSQVDRISKVETAQTQAYTDASVEKQTVVNLSNNFTDFRSEYRQDMSDVRRALMLPPSHEAAFTYKITAQAP